VGYATTTMKKKALEPCGWIKIIEVEPTVHMPLSGPVRLHLQKARHRTLDSAGVVRDVEKLLYAKLAKTKLH